MFSGKDCLKIHRHGQCLVWFGVLVILFLLVLPNVLLLLYENGPIAINRTGELLGTAIFVWLILLVVAQIRYFFFIALPFLWVMPLEALHIILYGRTSDVHIFGILSDTTFDEAFQYIKKYLPYVFCYLFIVSGLSVFLSSRAVTYKVRIPRLLIFSVFFSVVILSIGVGAGSYLIAKQIEVDGLDGKGSNSARLFEANYNVAEFAIVDVFPFGFLVRLSSYYKQVKQMEILRKNLESYSFDAKASSYEGKEIYVLVIGETARSKNISLNGYERETTPLLSQKKNLVSFANMVSGWLWTRMSVPVILTRKDVGDKNIFFPEKSVVSLFSEAGFKTYWLSMQSPVGVHDSPIALYSNEADHSRFLNPADYQSSGITDNAILPHFRKTVNSGDKLFVVLHLLGSHFNYGDRYPDAFDIFLPSMKNKNVALQDREEKVRLLNSYDNSLLFTDYILSEIIDIVDSQSVVSAVFYVSDHGEVIFDAECDKSGHGHHTEYDHMNAAMLWVSDSYVDKYPKKYARAFEKKYAPISTSNVFYSLAGMAGISYAGVDSSKDIFSEDWHVHPRNLQNGLDFDNSDRGRACREIIHKKQ